ncbi:MAG: hypothetical protein KIT16_12240 [Rhodospirillaceae bacterium]|nr:hypothetical protein [Rhodospirillaceae bacterium]
MQFAKKICHQLFYSWWASLFRKRGNTRMTIPASDALPYPRFVVTRGRGAGTVLFPHVHEDGTYVVSKTRFEKDYVRTSSLADAIRRVKSEGYSLRMSNPAHATHRAPSLIAPASLKWGDAD